MKTAEVFGHIQAYLKYILVLIAFLVWVLFFDQNNLVIQKKLSNQIIELEEERRTFVAQRAEISQKLAELEETPEILAREKYHMHKNNEIVFILED